MQTTRVVPHWAGPSWAGLLGLLGLLQLLGLLGQAEAQGSSGLPGEKVRSAGLAPECGDTEVF